MSSRLRACVFLLAWSVAGTAAAHVHIVSHQTRYRAFVIKDPPCGAPAATSERGDVVHVFEPGETITLEYDEYIPHPGHFRVSFDVNGEDDFVSPAGPDDLYTNDAVLLDGIAPHDPAGPGGYRSVDVTLPDVECDNCTLQFVQIMTDRVPYDPVTSLYYNCLDVVLAPEPRAGVAAGTALAVLLGLRRRARAVSP